MHATMTLSTSGFARKGGDLNRYAMAQFHLHTAGDATRPEVERCIADKFAQVHGAKITHFSKHLISLTCEQHLCAAVGLSPAAGGQLFAERYLDAPIQTVIANATGQSVERQDVLEIGNLVSSWKGSSLMLFVFLGELMHELATTWVVFTAIPEVQRLLAKLEFTPTVITHADPKYIADANRNWGSYYQKSPQVVFGEIQPAVAIARRGAMYRAMAKLIGSQVKDLAAQLRGSRT